MKGSFEVDNYKHNKKELFIRGHIEPINKEFVKHFSIVTLKVMFFAQFELDYCGG